VTDRPACSHPSRYFAENAGGICKYTVVAALLYSIFKHTQRSTFSLKKSFRCLLLRANPLAASGKWYSNFRALT
jgi:hypothetical protein